MMKDRCWIRLARYAFCGCAISLLSGCATKSPNLDPIFFPPDAEVARIQFLKYISNPADMGKKQSAFLTFLIGALPPQPGMAKPYGLALKKGKLYVCDTVGRNIHIVDLESGGWDYFHSGNMTALKKPINLDVDNDGTMYVADSGSGNIMIYGSNYVYKGTVGESGEMKPADVKVRDGRIYVADLKSHSVRVYDKRSKELMFSVPVKVSDEKAKLFTPTNIDLDSSGNILVSDTGAFRVQKFSPEGAYMKSYGSHGRQLGQFARNKGIGVDRENRFFCVDAAFHVCQVFDEEGRLLLFFGEPGGPRGSSLYLPAGVAVDYEHNKYFEKYVDPRFELDYLILIVNQYGPGRVNVYGMLRPRE